MNGKEAEKITGISRRNLRFYEDKGLIEPGRNPENDYRDYSNNDIERLKIIRGLRSIDVPIDMIGDFFNGKISMAQLSECQEKRLLEKQREVSVALDICKSLHSVENFSGDTVDNLLAKMDEPDVKKSLFDQWKDDYKLVSNIEDKMFFYIIPEKAVETRDDMTIALLDYAEENDMEIELIREGLNPLFKLDGITYSATCANSSYNHTSSVMYPEIFCQVVNSNEVSSLPLNKKQKFMKFIHNWWGAFIAVLIGGGLFIGREGFSVVKSLDFWVIIAGIVVICLVVSGFRRLPFHIWKGNGKNE